MSKVAHVLSLAGLSLLFAVAFDALLSLAGGYSLRDDRLALVALDAVFLAPVVWGVLAGIYVGGRVLRRGDLLRRAGWSSALLAGYCGVAAIKLWQGHPFGIALLLPILVFGIAFLIEAGKGREGMRAKPAGIAALIALILVALTATLPMPGRSMIDVELRTMKTEASAEFPNLILVVLDTLRADHIGAYGYEREITPWLDEFAERATVFEHVVASSSYTLPTHATIFTGLDPRSHGADLTDEGAAITLRDLGLQADKARVQPLSTEATTLAELAHDAGMETGAICANSAYLSRYFGLNQGFDTYVDAKGVESGQRLAGLTLGYKLLAEDWWWLKRLVWANEKYYLLGNEVNELALKWIERRRDRRFFLFLNYMEAHSPYLPTGAYRSLFPQSASEMSVEREAIERKEREITDAERATMVDPYDAEIRALDDYLKEFFEQLAMWGLMEETVVVFIGDHGESFGENYRFDHCTSVYEPQVRVPLIYRKPGQMAGERIARTVAMRDVFPSMTDDLKLLRQHGLEGVSLFDGEAPMLPVVSTLGAYERDFEEHAIYGDGWKMIRRSDGGAELYQISSDGAESNNLAEAAPELIEALDAELNKYFEKVQPRFESGEGAMDAETIKRLKALGYLK